MLGLVLGLRHPTLERIKEDNAPSHTRRYEMLAEWLKGTDGCRPSWAELINALRDETVQHGDIADKIEKMFN